MLERVHMRDSNVAAAVFSLDFGSLDLLESGVVAFWIVLRSERED